MGYEVLHWNKNKKIIIKNFREVLVYGVLLTTRVRTVTERRVRQKWSGQSESGDPRGLLKEEIVPIYNTSLTRGTECGH